VANTPTRTFRIPVDLLAAVQREARERHCSDTDVVVRALREHLARDHDQPQESYRYEELPIG
jgi:hypothetical protein